MSEEESAEDEETEEEAEWAVEESVTVAEIESADAELDSKRVVTGGDFECELLLGGDATAEFLRDLAHQLETGDEITVGTRVWEIPFAYGEPIEVEIEREAGDDGEADGLEIEVEFPGDSGGLSVR